VAVSLPIVTQAAENAEAQRVLSRLTPPIAASRSMIRA
jgi:hypothetical protein